MATFSWGDTARAAVATCFACFPQWRQTPDEDDDEQRNNTPSILRRDELESLLQNTEYSDGEMDTDAVSLHSDVGNARRRPRGASKRQKRRGRKSKGTIRLFGYDLFGRAVHADDDASRFSDDDDEDEEERRRRIARLSSSTLDSDPAPVEDDTIARLSTGQIEVQRPQVDEEAEAAAKKAARKEKRRQRKLSSALLNTERTAEFEGFQGSGDVVVEGGGAPFSPSSVLPPQDDFGAFQEARSPNSPSGVMGDDFVQVSSRGVILEDEADMHADFDAVAYVRRNSTASRSDSGSGSRSHTSTSVSRSEAIENARQAQPQGNNNNNNKQLHLRPPSLQDLRRDLLSDDMKPSSKRSRRSTTSGSGATSPISPVAQPPRRSRRSTTAGSSTSTTTTSSQPRSPVALSIPDVHIVQPLDNHLRIPQHIPAFEGVPEDDDEFTVTGSPLPSPLKSPRDLSNELPSASLSRGFPSPRLSTSGNGGNGFPSPGLGVRRNSAATANSGVFLARTGEDS